MSEEQKSKFGDFEEIKEETQDSKVVEEQTPIRVRLPKDKELIGTITQRYGGNRMEVLTTDGKKRNCRVPGRYKRRLWLRPKDIIIIIPWEDDDSKGDVIYKYHKSSLTQLRKRGILDSLKSEF